MDKWLTPIMLSLAISALGSAAVTWRDVGTMQKTIARLERDLDRVAGIVDRADELARQVNTNSHEIEGLRNADSKLEDQAARVDERVKALERKP